MTNAPSALSPSELLRRLDCQPFTLGLCSVKTALKWIYTLWKYFSPAFIKSLMSHVKTNWKLGKRKKKKSILMSVLYNISAAIPFCRALAWGLSSYNESRIPAHPFYHIILPIHSSTQINHSRSWRRDHGAAWSCFPQLPYITLPKCYQPTACSLKRPQT